MQKRIVMMGTGALGGYVGGYLAQHGHDVTLIDLWPENIETIRARGLELDGVTPEEKFTVRNAKTLHFSEVSSLKGQKPVDIAFISVKSYDTERVDEGDPAVPRARWLSRVPAELHERGHHRRPSSARAARSASSPPSFRSSCTRRAASAAWRPRAATSTPCSGSAKWTAASSPRVSGAGITVFADRQHQGDDQSVWRALDEARPERHEERHRRRDRRDQRRMRPQRCSPAVCDPARRRSRARGPGPGLPTGETGRARARTPRACQRRRRGRAGRNRGDHGEAHGIESRAPTSSARRWRRTWPRAGARRSSS